MSIIKLPATYIKELPADSVLLEGEKKHAELRNKKPTQKQLEIIEELKKQMNLK